MHARWMALLVTVSSCAPAAMDDGGDAPRGTLRDDATPDTVRGDARSVDADDALTVDADGARSDALDADDAMDATRRDATATDATDGARHDATPASDGGPCRIDGVEGACVDTAICSGGQVHLAGECPGPANEQCCAPPSASWCPTNGFALPNAGLVEGQGDDGCPDGAVRVDTFCIDRYEAALRVVDDTGSLREWSPFWSPAPGVRLRAVSLHGAVPQAHVSQVQAAAACAEAGKRLCTDAEWLRACRGPEATTYPYGPTRQPGVCNDARAQHPAVECFGTSASWVYDHLDYAGIDQQADTVDRTGTRTGCVTAEGALDMMGNLHEWTADPAGTFRGGFYADTTVNGPGCLYATTAHDVGYHDYSTGFRCCADVR